jgi:hypothetical protein
MGGNFARRSASKMRVRVSTQFRVTRHLCLTSAILPRILRGRMPIPGREDLRGDVERWWAARGGACTWETASVARHKLVAVAVVCALVASALGFVDLFAAVLVGTIGMVCGSIATVRAREEANDAEYRGALIALYASIGAVVLSFGVIAVKLASLATGQDGN